MHPRALIVAVLDDEEAVHPAGHRSEAVPVEALVAGRWFEDAPPGLFLPLTGPSDDGQPNVATRRDAIVRPVA